MLFFCFIYLNGCVPLEEKTITLSFWTDREIDMGGYNRIFANETHIGDLLDTISNPTCNDPKLLNFNINTSNDLILTARNEDGESVDIGLINLFSVSTGIKIKPSERGEIFVNHSLDDICTLVYINWK